MSFGKQLKNLRSDSDLTQEDIGNIVHVGKSTVSQWENEIHTPNIEIIVQIASYLNVSVDQLLARTASPIQRAHLPSDTPATEKALSIIEEELRKNKEK